MNIDIYKDGELICRGEYTNDQLYIDDCSVTDLGDQIYTAIEQDIMQALKDISIAQYAIVIGDHIYTWSF